jgi:alpha-L-rhamnosidase
VLHGATTMWERWDAIQPDGSIHTGEMATGAGGMLSFNHYAYGAVAEWLYRSVAGIAPDPDDPGYGTVVLTPVPGGGLTSAQASIDTPYGPSSISWALAGRALTIDLQIAAGARGWFVVPPGRWRAEHDGQPADVDALPIRDPYRRPGMELGSGRHHILLTKSDPAQERQACQDLGPRY